MLRKLEKPMILPMMLNTLEGFRPREGIHVAEAYRIYNHLSARSRKLGQFPSP
jgi:hypothetical protein